MLEFISKNHAQHASPDAEVSVSTVKDGNGGYTIRFSFTAKAERMISDEKMEAVSFAVDDEHPDRIYISPDSRTHGYALVKGKNRHTASKALYQRLTYPDAFAGEHNLIYDRGLKLFYIEADPKLLMEVQSDAY